jgi:hypothetical protein
LFKAFWIYIRCDERKRYSNIFQYRNTASILYTVCTSRVQRSRKHFESAWRGIDQKGHFRIWPKSNDFMSFTSQTKMFWKYGAFIIFITSEMALTESLLLQKGHFLSSKRGRSFKKYFFMGTFFHFRKKWGGGGTCHHWPPVPRPLPQFNIILNIWCDNISVRPPHILVGHYRTLIAYKTHEFYFVLQQPQLYAYRSTQYQRRTTDNSVTVIQTTSIQYTDFLLSPIPRPPPLKLVTTRHW